MSVYCLRVYGDCGISQLRCSFPDSMGYLMDQLTKFVDILPLLATVVGIVTLIFMAITVFWCIWIWGLEIVLRGLNLQKHFLCYVRDRLCGKVKIPLSVVIVTAGKWQLCYLNGYKFYTGGPIAPWDEALRRAGCIVTHLMADPIWLEERGNIFPQCLKEVKFNADSDE